MAAILRIRQSSVIRSAAATAQGPGPAKAYLDRLVKLVPAEVVGLYLAGKSVIQAVYPVVAATPGSAAQATSSAAMAYWMGWTLFCFAAAIGIRAWATSDHKNGTPIEWPAVVIATGSFAIWVYSMGDVFTLFPDLWQPLLGSLLVFAWTFVAPLIYRDPASPGPTPVPVPVPAPTPAPTPASELTAELAEPEGASLGGALGQLTPLRIRPARPDSFTEADAEQAVLKAAQALSGQRPSLSSKVSETFSDASQARKLLAKTQDVIADDYGKWVDLASGPDSEIIELMKLTYRELSSWVHEKATT